MKAKRVLNTVFFAALFLLASVLIINTAFADVPVVNSVKPWTRTSDNHVILNITITHRNYYTGHYVDSMQVDIDGTVNTVSLLPPQPVTFVTEYDMGGISTNPTVRARAHCTLHGSSSWSAPVQIGSDGGNGRNGGTSGGGLFNPNAPVTADLTLLLQIVIFLALLVGFVMARAKRSFMKHGAIMAMAVVLHTVSIFIVMVPSLLSSGGLFENWAGSLPIVMASHAALGILVEILGVYLVLAWALHPKDATPCFKRKNAMRVVIVCWLIELILGAYVYFLLYVSA